MKGSTIFLGLVAVGAVVFLAKSSSATPVAPAALTPLDPAASGWTVISWDPFWAQYQAAYQAQQATLSAADQAVYKTLSTIPAHSYVAGPDLNLIASSAPSLGTVQAWVAAQKAAGHKVFQSPKIVFSSTSTNYGYAFVIDAQPAGYTQVA